MDVAIGLDPGFLATPLRHPYTHLEGRTECAVDHRRVGKIIGQGIEEGFDH